jgi:hypothetical protein
MERFSTNNRIVPFLLLLISFSSYTTDLNNTNNKPGSNAQSGSLGCTRNIQATTAISGQANVNDIDALLSYTNKVAVLHVTDKERGGDFQLINDNSIQDDNGLVFSAGAFGKGWHWVREIKKEDPVNVKWFGAKGLGIDHYKEDSAALVNAIKSIAQKKGGKLYIPASESYYGFNGNGIVLPDNIEIYGDGRDKSEIKHVNPTSGTYYRGVVFFTTTYGPTASIGIFKAPAFTIKEALAKQGYVIFKKAAEAAKFETGTIIGLGGKKYFKNNDQKLPKFGQFELNEIVKISADTVFLKYPTTTPFQGNEKAPPVIVAVNGKHTVNAKLSESSNATVEDRVTKNIYIHDLKLSQAGKDMINNKPYDLSRPPSNLIALGGTFESKFENLALEGFGTFGGNMWNRCEISNLNIISANKLFDLGYGSCNTVIHDVKWTFKSSEADTSSISLLYLNEGSHHIEIYNIAGNGNWSGKHLMQITGGANNIYLHDITLDLPAYNSPNSYGVLIKDDEDDIIVHDVELKNITIKLNTIGQYIRLIGGPGKKTAKNITFDNVKFVGKAKKQQGYSVYVKDFGNIKLKDLDIPEGNIMLSDVGEGEVDGLTAPNSVLVVPNATSKEPKITRANIKSKSNKENKKDD